MWAGSTVEVAQIPVPPGGDDRVFRSAGSVVVLDGATQLIDSGPAVGEYTDRLGRALLDGLDATPALDVRRCLAMAIDRVSGELSLSPGNAPSSTVALVRKVEGTVDVLVLGDTTVVVGTARAIACVDDRRLADLRLPARDSYRHRLRAGNGFDSRHHALLREAQRQARPLRNREGGFYVAEAEPHCAYRAYVRSFDADTVRWFVIATDGAHDTLTHLGAARWPELARAPATAHQLLQECHEWEAVGDPSGQRLPRAKRHDDKTLVVVAVA